MTKQQFNFWSLTDSGCKEKVRPLADPQADLSLGWAQSQIAGVVMRLINLFCALERNVEILHRLGMCLGDTDSPAAAIITYSKTCVKWPLSKRPKIGFQDQFS